MPKIPERCCHHCKHHNQYFGDCFHPKSDGAVSPRKASDECVEQGYRWFEKRVSATQTKMMAAGSKE